MLSTKVSNWVVKEESSSFVKVNTLFLLLLAISAIYAKFETKLKVSCCITSLTTLFSINCSNVVLPSVNAYKASLTSCNATNLSLCCAVNSPGTFCIVSISEENLCCNELTVLLIILASAFDKSKFCITSDILTATPLIALKLLYTASWTNAFTAWTLPALISATILLLSNTPFAFA